MLLSTTVAGLGVLSYLTKAIVRFRSVDALRAHATEARALMKSGDGWEKVQSFTHNCRVKFFNRVFV